MKTEFRLDWKMGPMIVMLLMMMILAASSGVSSHLALAQTGETLLFVENVGQFEESIRFRVYGGPAALSLTEEALWFTLFEKSASAAPGIENPEDVAMPASERGVNLRLSFSQANPQPALEPFNRLDASVSYFIGNDPARWQANAPVWGGVRYVDLYPGLDLEISAENGQLAQRLIVRDSAALSQNDQPDAGAQAPPGLSGLALRVEGAEALALDEPGRLRLTTDLGDVSLPLLQIQGEVQIAAAELSPRLEGELVIQPFAGDAMGLDAPAQAVEVSDLLYSTFLGGAAGLDDGRDIAVDSAGNAYVTGQAYAGFPTTPGAFDTSIEGVFSDVFVAKLNAAGSDLIYATFLGGSDFETGWGIELDEAGNAYLAGYTTSPDFATTPGAFDSSLGGTSDAFVAKLNPTGAALIYATLLGGESGDFGWAVAVDQAGSAYVTGFTPSADFPTTPDAFDPTPNVWYDAFIVKMNAAGSDLVYSTLVGGNSADYSFGIAVDESGSAYITGYTHSTDFPVTPGAFDTSYDNQEIFVVKVNPAGSDLAYGTYLGGSGTEYGNAIAVDEAGSVYLTGTTRSTDFPVTEGAFDTGYNSNPANFEGDSFLARLSPAGDGVIYATYLGGGGDDIGQSLALDAVGSAYVAGYTTSPDFPTSADAFDAVCENCNASDAFVAKISPGGTTLTYATYLGGGNGSERAYGLAVDGANNIYVAGYTTSPDFPTTAGAFDTSLAGTSDVFVSKLATPANEPEPQPTPTPPPAPVPVHSCAPTPLGVVAVGNTPRGIAVDSARRRVYVANFGSNSVSVIDSQTNTVIKTIPGVAAANGIAYDPTHNLIWATNYSSNRVTPIQVNGQATSFTVLPALAVGAGPWGVAYDPVHDQVYVANNLSHSVTVIAAASRTVVATLSGSFNQPFHLAANPITGKVYVANFGSHSVTVMSNGAVSRVVDLYDSSQPYGIAVDEMRDQVYVATVAPHRIVAIGPLRGAPDQFLGWAAFYRGFGNRNRPIPMRAIAINPELGPFGDGGHVWATTSTADGSELNQALLIPKGWSSYFHYPLIQNVSEHPAEGVAVDRLTGRVYVASSAAPGVVTVIGDHANLCPGAAPAALPDDANDIEFELFSRELLAQGDVTGDGQVDIFDLTLIAARYDGVDPAADVNEDGRVDLFDLTIAASHYGRGISAPVGR